jgi:hypothetical protein
MFLTSNVQIRIYRTIILPVIVYGCETWSDIKGGTWIVGVWEQVVGRISGLKRDDEGRNPHNEGLRNFYSLPHIIRIIMSRIKWMTHVE